MRKLIKNNLTLILTICLVLTLTIVLTGCLSIEGDFLWHIKSGEYMTKHGILTTDVFSWYMYGKPWISHEWLFEILIYNGKNLLGDSFYVIFPFLCIGILEVILFLYNKKYYQKNILFTLLWISFGFILYFFIQIRPHLVSYIFLALTIWFLYDLYDNPDSKKIYFLPVLSILWSNVHGGSSNLGYVLCFVFLIAGLFNFKCSKIEAVRINKKQRIKYFVAMVLSMLAVCINVHGVKMFIYPYQNMSDSLMLSSISEWQPSDLNNLSHYPFFVLAIFILFIFVFSKKKVLLIDFILFGISLFLGLKSIRFWPFMYIIMNFVVFKYIGKRKPDKGTNLSIFIIIVLLSAFCICNGFQYKKTDDLFLDDEVIDILKKEKPERLYNFYDYGGQLIYNDIMVFVDGRADLYSKYNFEDYLNISRLVGDYPKLLEKYDFDYFLVSEEYQINNYLKYSDDYELLYKNKDLAFNLYKKK